MMNSNLTILWTLIGLLILSSCGTELFRNRSFVDEMEAQDDRVWQAGQDFQVVGGDISDGRRNQREVISRTPASGLTKEETEYNSSILQELKQKEARLTPQEWQVYSQLKYELATPSEKIYYLNLARRDRGEYLDSRQDIKTQLSKSVVPGKKKPSRALASLNSYRSYRDEVVPGMGKEQVVNKWGRPLKVDVAGNPAMENERWTFYENGRTKQVYFESGRVQGWSLD